MGLIAAGVAEDLDRIKTVRNKFAHEEAVSFDDDKVAGALNGDARANPPRRAVRLPSGFEDAEPRTKFQYAIAGLAGYLEIRIRSAKRPSEVAPEQDPERSWLSGIRGQESD